MTSQEPTGKDVARLLGSLVIMGVGVALAMFGYVRLAAAYSNKGALHLDVTVHHSSDGYHAVGTFSGEIKHPEPWLCPLVAWSCETKDGFKLRGSQRIESPCSRDTVQRTFEWSYDVHEPCRVRFALEPTSGKRPLVGYGPEIP